MEVVDIKFEPSGRSGVVAVGSYLLDAARRLGVKIEDEFGEEGLTDACFVKVVQGADLLSEPTKVETEHLNQDRRNKGERLPSQAKIEKTGELIVMVTEKQDPEKSTYEKYRREFDELPLDEKVKNLLELESVTLSETFSYILNLPYTIGAKVRDGIAEFGFKMEENDKNARRPEEHRPHTDESAAADTSDEPVHAAYASDAGDKKAAPKKGGTRKNAPRAAGKPQGEAGAK